MEEGDVNDVAGIDADAFTAASVSPEERRAQLREELARPWSRTWMARVDGHLVAFLLVWHVADEIHVLNLATLPSERRRGYARALLEHVIDGARRGAVRHVLLEVRRSNAPAIALYRGQGFVAAGLRRKYYQDNEDAIEMALGLDPATGETVPRTDEVAVD